MFDKCSDCAKKHLRAALAYVLEDGRSHDVPWGSTSSVSGFVSQAVVLLGEAGTSPEAYRSHYDLAVGCLVKAEELAVQVGFPKFAKETREFRLGLGFSAGKVTMPKLPSFVDLALGHWCEAIREGRVEVGGVMTDSIFLVRFKDLMEAQDAKKDEEE
jgi:hypothetical protein